MVRIPRLTEDESWQLNDPPPASQGDNTWTWETNHSAAASQSCPLNSEASSSSFAPCLNWDQGVICWDYEISLALQHEGMDDPLLAPIPEDVPLPVGGLAQYEPKQHLDAHNDEEGDWLDRLRDRRVLRGRTSSTTSLSSPTPSIPPVSSPRDGGQSVRGRWRHHSQRRPNQGRQRSLVRVRLREAQSASASSSSSTSPWPRPAAPEIKPCVITAMNNTGEEPVLEGHTFTGKNLVSPQATAGRGDNSTTAGEDFDGAHSSSEETHWPSSSSDTPPTESAPQGFCRHGVWVGRPRTDAELGRHRGGSGMQRTSSAIAVCRSTYVVNWKPAWLRKYTLPTKR
eukprot:s2357_g8.t1